MYSALLLNHFQNPRNVGDIVDPDARAESENPACGDRLRLTFRISGDRIVRAQFKAKGCVAAIACGSALTELVAGKTLKEALRLRREDVSDAVGGLPQASVHAAQLALDALSAGLRSIQTSAGWMPSSHMPRRIASLQPSATVILAAVGELDRLVACTKYCADVVPEIKSQSPVIVADSWTADAAQIITVRPDLIIASVPYQEKAVIEILKAGVRFLGLAPKTLADIYTDIGTIAGIVGASERGKKVIADMKRRIEDVRTQTSGLPRPTVFCEEWGKPLISSQPWVAELVEAAGGEFVSAPGQQTSAAPVARMDPEALIAAWCGAGDRVPLDKIVATRNWQGMRAVRNGRVYCIRDEYLNTPAPTLLHGLEALAFALHPELFPRPKGICQITGVPSDTAANLPL